MKSKLDDGGTKILRFLVCFFLILLISCANNHEESAYYVPILLNNKSCVTEYLDSMYLKNYKVIESNDLIELTEGTLGVLKITPNKGRNIDAVLSTIKHYCFPNKSIQTQLLSGGWSSISNDLENVASGNSRELDRKHPIFMKIDIEKKNYTVFQYLNRESKDVKVDTPQSSVNTQ